ncbi:MAG: aspartate dehydrogenase [Candidatus Altiarchaeota archaeon]|nr:aspartate dehydrogenase [Candidatus Altiarchaeota archaeon]
MKIAVLGCGNIGKAVAGFVDREAGMRLAGLFDLDAKKAGDLAGTLNKRPKVYASVEELLEDEAVEYVLEAASQEAVRAYGIKLLESGKNVVIMSVGAFSDEGLLEGMRKVAGEKGLKVYIPSGAVAGIDGIRSAIVGGIASVSLTTRKNPRSLGIDAGEEIVLYDGPAREGVRRYPKNVNIASTISLAGIGLDRTRLRVIADPRVEKNVHELRVKGVFGEFCLTLENLPSPENPGTSYLAVLSAIATLKDIEEPVRMGT